MADSVVGRLVYRIAGDLSGIEKSLKGAEKKINSFTKFVRSASGLFGVVAAYRALSGVAKDLIASYSGQEKAEAALAAALRMTGGDLEDLMSQYRAFASSVQESTTVGDEQVLALMQQGKSLGITNDKLKEATQGAIGLSKALGMDIATAMRAVALGFQGNYTLLNRYIPALRGASSEAEKQAVLQKAMAEGFELAKAEAATGTGAMLQLQNAIGDLKEQGGKALVDFLEPSIRSLTKFVTETASAIAETQRLKRTAEELSAGKTVAASDELVLLDKRLKDLEVQRQVQRDMYGEATEGIESEIAGIKRRMGALAEAARWEAIGREAKRKGDAEAASRAEEEARRQKELADWVKVLNEEYARTPEGQREILEAQIAKWDYEFARSKNYRPQIQAILDMLYKQREANGGITQEIKDQIDAMETMAQEAQVDLSAQASAVLALAQIKEREREKELEAERQLQEQMKNLRREAADFLVSIWGQLDSVNQARLGNQLAALDYQHKSELANFTGTQEEKQKLVEEYERERAKLEYEAALRSWKLQVAGGLAAAARAILEAAKNTWPIPALPMTALATIMGGVQLAAIRAAKPVPSFSEGADFVVPPGYPNDSYPMLVESGERVRVDPSGGAAAGGEMLHATFILDGRQIAQFVTRATRNRQILVAQRSIVE